MKKYTKKQLEELLEWYDHIADYLLENHPSIYNNAMEYAKKQEQE